MRSLTKRCAWSSARATEWGRTASPTWPQLTGASWIPPTPDSPARLAAEHLFRARGRPLPTDIVESLSILTNIGLLRAPYVALMPRTAARQFSDAGLLRILDLPEMGAFGTVGYTLRLHREPSAACRTFIACLRDAAPHGSDAAIERAIELYARRRKQRLPQVPLSLDARAPKALGGSP